MRTYAEEVGVVLEECPLHICYVECEAEPVAPQNVRGKTESTLRASTLREPASNGCAAFGAASGA